MRFAFEYARDHGRRKVTAGHKANIMKFSDGLFLETARRVAAEYPDVAFEDRIVDNLCDAARADARRTTTCSCCRTCTATSSPTCARGSSAGSAWRRARTSGERCAVFEATHGAAPGDAPDRANPMALMLSGAMLLRHLGEREAGDRLEAAVAAVIAEGRALTADLGPRDGSPGATTSDVTRAVLRRLAA